MKYIFHIGERCNSYYGLNKYNILSGVNPLNGIYISFENSIKHINTQFNDFINDPIKFNILDKKICYYAVFYLFLFYFADVINSYFKELRKYIIDIYNNINKIEHSFIK